MTFDVTLPGAALAAAAHWTAALAPRRPTEPALAGALLVADTFGGGSFTMSGTDYDTTGVAHARDVDVTDGGRRLVSARLLADIAGKIAREPSVRLVDDDGGDRLAVSTGDGSYWSLPLLDTTTYPGLPTPPAVVASVPAAAFAHALDRVAIAVSESTAPPMFGGISLHTDPDVGLVVAATDRYRLAIAEIDHRPALPDGTGVPLILVPAPILRAAVTAIGDGRDVDDVTIHAAPDAGTVSLCTTDHQITGRLLDGTADAWRRIDRYVTATAPQVTVDVEAAALRIALERATVALDPHEPVLLTIDIDAVTIAASRGERARASHPAPLIAYDGTPARLACKPEYLRDLLAGVGADTIRLRYLAGRNPMIGATAVVDGVPDTTFRMAQAPVSLTTARRAA